MQTTLRGVGVSHGVAIGEVRHMGTAVLEPPAKQVPPEEAEREPVPLGWRSLAVFDFAKAFKDGTTKPGRGSCGGRFDRAWQSGRRRGPACA